jgi:hypothetical protein
MRAWSRPACKAAKFDALAALTHSKPYPDQTVASTKIVPWLFARVEYGVEDEHTV